MKDRAFMLVAILDETIPGRGPAMAASVEIDATVPITARDILRERVRQEVERYHAGTAEVFQGLVQPEESERVLNGYRVPGRRPLDAETQFRRACASFDATGFLLVVDDRQVESLDTPLALTADSLVQFIKLVPLVGG